LVYWLSQIVGSIAIGLLLDRQAITRRIRAFSGWTVLLAMVFIVHVWAFFYQKCVQSRQHILCDLIACPDCIV
jgi:hypothetical protein